jgi:phage portal protein BeeE
VTISRALARRPTGPDEQRFSVDTWLSDYLLPSWAQGVSPFVRQTLTGTVQEVVQTLPGYAAALRRCPPAFAAQMVRASVLSQARFTFRNRPTSRTPRRTFGTQALAPLEQPWTNATTGSLIARMEWHAGLAGNAFVASQGSRLRVLRPDWTAIIYGSELEPADAPGAIDGEIVGYAYVNGGWGAGGRNQTRTLLPAEVAHWAPLPDPESPELGMSWITPAVREIQGDAAVTEHKLRYFANGATPNMVVKGLPATTPTQFQDLVDMLEAQHRGVANAYRTMYLVAGADATVVGSNLSEIDMKGVQGAGETRISVLSRVHPVILAIAEGLAGSSLNAGNFGMARRIWADTWITPTLQDLCASLASIVAVPSDAELWFDVQDMPILREDAKDAADIAQVQATAIRALTDGGFDPASAVAAVAPNWAQVLQHTGLLSVQLNPPGGPAGLPPEQQAARNLVEMIQKVYLGVGVVVSEAEARELLNQAGASLPLPGPQLSPAPSPTAGGV